MEPTVLRQQAQAKSRLYRNNIESLVMANGLTYEEAKAKLEAEFAGWAQEVDWLALQLAMDAIRVDRDRVQFLSECTLRAGRIAWYNGPSEGALEWNNFINRLRSLNRSKDEIELVDRESTTVLSLLDNPGTPKFSTRGLVVGHVQSGKTGNMAALLAKAAGTPYKFFVVLSGLTNSLRNQTQKRFDADILDLASAGRWHRHTKADVRHADGRVSYGDFRAPVGGLHLGGSTRHLAVMKKNASVLRRFLAAIRDTPRALLESTPFIIIDDECDQASVNSAAYDRAVTTINGLLRDILRALPRVAYVGYTATPYANVLINTADTDDLYPRHFIHALGRPKAYFGAEELFGRAALEGDASDDGQQGKAMIRQVQDGEVAKLRPVSRGGTFTFEVTSSLEQAIRYFVMGIAALEVRGLGGNHASMLVHTSMLNSVHSLASGAIEPYLRNLVQRLEIEDRALLEEMRDLWVTETDLVPAEDFGLSAIPFEKIRGRLAEAAAAIEVKIENFESTDRINYDNPARRYLVIGGNVLARGLTLEGLMVSLFMRTSSQYDTLMQMGRWFGYRPGFEDLPRVWMESGVKDAFFDLATVEEEIRRDIAVYAKENLTPQQFAVRIRRIPGLMITNRARMRSAVMAQVGYAGNHVQTIRFPRTDRQWLEGNWNAGARLLHASTRLLPAGNIFSTDLTEVLAFLSAYQVRSNSSGLDTELISKYLRRAVESDPTLERWNVGVVTTEDGADSQQPLGPLGTVRCVSRSAMRGDQSEAFIKALMSKRDLLIDMTDAPRFGAGEKWERYKQERNLRSMPPLLLLYPIDRKSHPQTKSKDRVDLNAAHDVLGLGIVFPGDAAHSHDYVAANLQPLDYEDVEGIDDSMEALITNVLTEDPAEESPESVTGGGQQ